MTEETPSGAGTTHTAHGIIIQEVSTAKENISESPEEFDQARADLRNELHKTLSPAMEKTRSSQI